MSIQMTLMRRLEKTAPPCPTLIALDVLKGDAPFSRVVIDSIMAATASSLIAPDRKALFMGVSGQLNHSAPGNGVRPASTDGKDDRSKIARRDDNSAGLFGFHMINRHPAGNSVDDGQVVQCVRKNRHAMNAEASGAAL